MKKLVAGRLQTQLPGPHPDAEVLSAFADDALRPSERQTVTEHLAACRDCRDIVFLASATQPEPQQVIAPPKARTHLAFRWGTLAACVAIGAILLTARHQSPRTEQALKNAPETQSAPVASPAPAADLVAMDKHPAEVDAIREKQLVARAAPARTINGHAEPKAITAAPKATMAFEDSGQIALQNQAAADAKLESRDIKDLPINGRNWTDLAKANPGAASSPASSPAPAPVAAAGQSRGAAIGGNIGGPLRSDPTALALPSKESAIYGYVSGTVFDASGAVVPNVKITATGPSGQKTAISDDAGKFALGQLPAGTYSLKADASGFAEAKSEVAVLPQKAENLDFKLQVGTTAESVSVNAAAAPVQTAQAEAVVASNAYQTSNELSTVEVQAQTSRKKASQKTAAKQKAGPSIAARPSAAMAGTLPNWQWSVSPEGSVRRSSDNGATWQPIAVADGVVFTTISSGANHVWAGGKAGTLYHSVDFGQHWSQVVPTAKSGKLQADIIEIRFSDPQRGTVTTSNGQLWITADGGQTWSRK